MKKVNVLAASAVVLGIMSGSVAVMANEHGKKDESKEQKQGCQAKKDEGKDHKKTEEKK